jgi:hypothetical protein
VFALLTRSKIGVQTAKIATVYMVLEHEHTPKICVNKSQGFLDVKRHAWSASSGKGGIRHFVKGGRLG